MELRLSISAVLTKSDALKNSYRATSFMIKRSSFLVREVIEIDLVVYFLM